MNNLQVIETGGQDEPPELFVVNVTKEEAQWLIDCIDHDLDAFPEYAEIAGNVINRLSAICNGPFLKLVE